LVSEEEAGLLGHGRLIPYGAAVEDADKAPGSPSDGEVRCAVASLRSPAGPADESGLALIAVLSATPHGWRPLVVWDTGGRDPHDGPDPRAIR